MKALILAAGFGTRLLPHTIHKPKPLFTIGGQPLLDIWIWKLIRAGCKTVMVNTHHLSGQIASFIRGQQYPVPVKICYEPEILGTGGAIKNAADFFGNHPFLVINCDVLTDIDPGEVYNFHQTHNHPVTLVLVDDPSFGHVSVSQNEFVTGFHNDMDGCIKLAFTGIQVVDREFSALIPDNTFYSSIDAFRTLLTNGKKISAYMPKNVYWNDLGTPERYSKAAAEQMNRTAFDLAWPDYSAGKNDFQCDPLKGGGSDRCWYRRISGDKSLILADHGIRRHDIKVSETDAFVQIGQHLKQKGIPVPEIILFDRFSGLVFNEDLGDVNLRQIVRDARNLEDIINIYKTVIDSLIKMSVLGAENFDLSWTWQTPQYDRNLIMEKECRYFVDAFLRGYAELDAAFDDFQDEFAYMAENALEFGINGFMHRDLQSQNIMVKDGHIYFIDFQGGRMGPIQYDLASLLIDPYVELADHIRQHLLIYCIEKLAGHLKFDPVHFTISYTYCALCRNLQMLGAFGFLSRVKGKTWFESHIPAALKTLKQNIDKTDDGEFPKLKYIISRI